MISPLSGQYYGMHTVFLQLFTKSMNAIGLIRKNEQGIYTLNKWESLIDIITGTHCNNDSDRHTMCIHGQMYFSVEPPFMHPIS